MTAVRFSFFHASPRIPKLLCSFFDSKVPFTHVFCRCDTIVGIVDLYIVHEPITFFSNVVKSFPPTTAYAQAFVAYGGMLTSSPELSQPRYVFRHTPRCYCEFVMRTSTVREEPSSRYVCDERYRAAVWAQHEAIMFAKIQIGKCNGTRHSAPWSGRCGLT